MIKVLILLICISILLHLYKKDRLISSTSMWILCYILIFIICPLYININYNNEKLIDILALMGIIIFSIGYYLANKIKIYIKKRNKNLDNKKELRIDFRVPFIFFCIFFTVTVYILIKYIGIQRISLILGGKITAKQLSLGTEVDTNPLSFAMHLLVPCILSMWISAKSKRQMIISLVALIIYIIETILFGFTRLFLISILGIIFFYQMRDVSRKKQIFLVIITFISIIALLIFMNFFRTNGFSRKYQFKEYINMDYIFESTDFNASYKFFNDLLDYSPQHVNPIVYLKPFFAIIPRSIWQNKPEPISMQILKYINPFLVKKGFSTAGNSVLGEGYAILGYIGIVINCFIWGWLCCKLDIRYKERIKKRSLVSIKDLFYYIFSVFIVISGQRGDWSQYMTIVLWFYFLPIYIFSKINISNLIDKKKERKN